MPKKKVLIKADDVDEYEVYCVNAKCPYCGEENYIESEHTRPYDHSCELCEKVFSIKYDDE